MSAVWRSGAAAVSRRCWRRNGGIAVLEDPHSLYKSDLQLAPTSLRLKIRRKGGCALSPSGATPMDSVVCGSPPMTSTVGWDMIGAQENSLEEDEDDSSEEEASPEKAFFQDESAARKTRLFSHKLATVDPAILELLLLLLCRVESILNKFIIFEDVIVTLGCHESGEKWLMSVD
ncbi:hypothetical protein KSP39_PZI002019 [Platanthera zijinensis]|uniref:Uncharacterized protein n=1 Tax=Platanthera zijinensis TaxID=2320716 RepID=A0AAP0GEN4_9ASPA